LITLNRQWNILYSDVIHTIYNDDDIISIELLKRRNIGKTGLRSEYFIRRIVMPANEYDEEIPKSKFVYG